MTTRPNSQTLIILILQLITLKKRLHQHLLCISQPYWIEITLIFQAHEPFHFLKLSFEGMEHNLKRYIIMRFPTIYNFKPNNQTKVQQETIKYINIVIPDVYGSFLRLHGRNPLTQYVSIWVFKASTSHHFFHLAVAIASSMV